MSLIDIEVVPASKRSVLVSLDRKIAGVREGLAKGLEAGAIYIASYIKGQLLSGQLVHNRTGNLRRAVFSKLVDEQNAVVGVGKEAPYARFVNDGTRPHTITAVNARALRFTIGGQVFFRKSVNHPGIRAREFMEQGLANTISEVRRIIIDRVLAEVHHGGSSEGHAE